MSSETNDDQLVENSSSRVLGVGSGTFAVGVMFFSTILVWIFTSPQTGPLKSVIRAVVTLMCLTVFAILLLADRESQYQSTGEVVQVSCSMSPKSIQ
jgi:low temperature requirement protein LtrA